MKGETALALWELVACDITAHGYETSSSLVPERLNTKADVRKVAQFLKEWREALVGKEE